MPSIEELLHEVACADTSRDMWQSLWRFERGRADAQQREIERLRGEVALRNGECEAKNRIIAGLKAAAQRKGQAWDALDELRQFLGPAAQAVAPASPVRAEESGVGYWRKAAIAYAKQADVADAELAALRKQVEEGERDTKRLSRLSRILEQGNDWSTIWGRCTGVGIRFVDTNGHQRQVWGATLREAIDAATPEPKEPANG